MICTSHYVAHVMGLPKLRVVSDECIEWQVNYGYQRFYINLI